MKFINYTLFILVFTINYFAEGQVIKTDTTQSRQYFQQGMSKFDAEDYTNAIDYFTKALAHDQNYSEAYKYRGRSYYRLKEYKNAIEDFNKAIYLTPKDSYLFFYRGLSYEFCKDYKNAIEDYSKIIELNPSAGKPYYYRGDAKRSLGDYKGAIEDFNDAIKYDPHFNGSYISRGLIKWNLKDYKGAIEDYTIAITKDRNNSILYYNRGVALMDIHEYKNAVNDFDYAILIKPEYNFYYNRGMCKEELSDRSGAIEDYDKSLALEETYDAFYKRGILKAKLKDLKGALEDFKSCERIDPKRRDVAYYYFLGDINIELFNYSEAIKAYTASLEMGETYNAFYQRGISKAKLKDFKGGLEDLKSCERINPSKRNVTYYIYIGAIYAELSNYSEAFKAYTTSLEMEESAEGYYERGLTRIKQKDFKGAESDFKKSNSIMPNAIAFDGLNRVYFEKKDYSKALEYCDKAIQLDSTFIKARLDKAVTKNVMGDTEGAIAEYGEVIKLDSNNVFAYLERSALMNGNILDINKALAHDPDNPRAYGQRAVARLNEGNLAEALADCDKLLELQPTAHNYSTRASIKYYMEDIKGAVANINKSIALAPANPVYYYNRGVYRMNDLTASKESILSDFNKAIELNKDYGDAYYYRAMVKLKAGDKKGACSDMQMALKLKVEAAEDEIEECCGTE